MRKRAGTLILVGILAVLLAAGVLMFGIVLPQKNAVSTMPAGGEIVIVQQPDGKLEVSWPQGENADSYCIEVLVPASSPEGEEKSVYRDIVSETSCVLPALPEDMELTLRVSSVGEYNTLGKENLLPGENPLSVTTTFNAPRIWDQCWDVDTDAKTANVSFSMNEGDHCLCYIADENGREQLLRDLTESPMLLQFGEGGDLPLPEEGEPVEMRFYGYREQPGLKFYGSLSVPVSVEREHLLGRTLDVECIPEKENMFTLSWGEAKGERYAVQLFAEDTGDWTTLTEIPWDAERHYTTPHMPAGRAFQCRVVSLGGQTLPGSDVAAVSEAVTLTTGPSVIYATAWPTRDLPLCQSPDQTFPDGRIKAGTAVCVLGEKNGSFAIRVDGLLRYIDSRYCLINLPEYMGDLCSYDITNSYDSKYMVHEFGIPSVTGVVTGGYENVRQFDGDFLVPLLYPTAKKLVRAAENAAEQGYKIKIYDAFRPNRATQEIYNLTAGMINDPLPPLPYTNVSLDSLDLPNPEDYESYVPEVGLTYKMVMTLNYYELGAFLAKGASLHNLGIAMDLTLEDLETGEEVPMQSSIHDLSAYSVTTRNGDNAKMLADIMTRAGFGTLFSEWWHFQDNDARSELSPPVVYEGVSGEGWMADDTGWRYRKADGSFASGEMSIGDETFSFDEYGYVKN